MSYIRIMFRNSVPSPRPDSHRHPLPYRGSDPTPGPRGHAWCPRRDSNAHYPAPRAGASCQIGLRGHGVANTEPPSGADPDRPPYEGGAAAVRGGEASGGGLEPPRARVRALLGTPTPHPEPRTGGEIRTRKRPGLSRPGIPSSRHARVPPRGLEPLHPRLRVWCPARRAQAAYKSEWRTWKLPTRASARNSASELHSVGADTGDRTPILSLEGCCSAIELHPRGASPLNRPGT